jgi:hypothetical protein
MKRQWPSRADHKPPKPPEPLKLTDEPADGQLALDLLPGREGRLLDGPGVGQAFDGNGPFTTPLSAAQLQAARKDAIFPQPLTYNVEVDVGTEEQLPAYTTTCPTPLKWMAVQRICSRCHSPGRRCTTVS